MSDPDRRARDLELLKKSRQALHDDQNRPERKVPEPDSEDAVPAGRIMYRGKPVRTGGAGPKVPGAGAGRPVPKTGQQFRGSGRGTPGSGGPKRELDIKQVLQKLTDLRQTGLITKAEYEKKRAQIIDRL